MSKTNKKSVSKKKSISLGNTDCNDKTTEQSDNASSLGNLDDKTPAKRIAQVEEDQKRLENIAQRAQADLINYKKRSQEEATQSIQRNTMQIMLMIIPIIDDFEIALEHIKDDADADEFTAGVKLIKRKLSTLLEINSVKPIPVSTGDIFNPTIHEAIQYQETSEVPDNTVVHIIRSGYYHKEQTLRPTQVLVASEPKL